MPWWACLSCMNIRDRDEILSLDFSHHTLHDVPPDVFQYERTLEELYLSSNRITDLPRQLFYCQELKILHINDNELSIIPPAISSLTNLQQIYLARNALTTIPDTIKSCKHLVCLDLSVNSLERVPDAITSLISLQELFLNDTFLEFLPANFGRLINLRILELRDNNLITLPKSMTRLINLLRLDIGHNEFTELPEIIGHLINLNELWIDNNRIRRISQNVGNLRKLIHFEASNNLLTHLPNEIGSWIKLQELSVSANELEHLPFSIGLLKNLIAIKADENQLQELPESICQLDNLEELMISHNDLFRLPPSIGLLRKLRYLTADENLLRHLPNELCSCIALTILSVRGNKLTEIPPDIGHLTNLKVLNIVNNFITYLPVSLLGLTQLSALWISDNQSIPLMPMQKEYGPEQSVHLTCFMLPQVLSNSSVQETKSHDTELYQIPPSNGVDEQTAPPIVRSINPIGVVAATGTVAIAKRRICFASDPIANVEQASRLMRSPTPYPKELRVLAKYAKNMQKIDSGDYAQIDDITFRDQQESGRHNHQEMEQSVMTASQHGNTIENQPLLYDTNQIRQSLSVQRSEIDQKIDSNQYQYYRSVEKIGPLIDYETMSNTGSYSHRNYDGNEQQQQQQQQQQEQLTDESVRVRSRYGGVEYVPTNRDYRSNLTGQATSFINHHYQSYHSGSGGVSNSSNTQNPLLSSSPATQNESINDCVDTSGKTNRIPSVGECATSTETVYNNDLSSTNQTINRLSICSDNVYGNHSTTVPPTTLLDHQSNNHLGGMIRQPPPYHIAKAFTKKSKIDLMIYDNYRNQNQSSARHFTDDLNNTDCVMLNENFNNCVNSSRNDVDGVDERMIDLNLNTNQKADGDPIHDGNDDHDDVDEVDDDDDDEEDENVVDDDDVLSHKNQLHSMQQSGQVHTNSGSKGSWFFGLHKNPTVIQLSLSKSPDMGFTLREVPKQGIFIQSVTKNSIANDLLLSDDKILNIDGVDCTRSSLKEALTVLSNAGPIVNLMISRK